ncbi:MAG: outer membrane protein assembly factor BamC [Betaproteobacteria bacterium]|nr:MAG: outer membrane protein assembly factor BamC [Betaproteobacteria bacterium]
MTVSLGKKIEYKSAGSAPALEIPPDLTTPTYDDRYEVTTASGAAAARAAGRPTEVLPVNPDARLMRAGSERWLVVKAPQEAAWNTLREFWTKNGFVVAIEQPAIGIMETDWAENRAAVPQDFIQRFTSKYVSFLNDTYKRDKFRSRIERGSEPGTVEIYISHRGAQQIPTKYTQGAGEDWVWAATPPNPELEAEMLGRLMLAFGTPPAKAEQSIAAVAGAPDRGLYFVRYANPEITKLKEEGWLSGVVSKLQFWKSDSADKPEQYRVVVTQADPSSLVTVQDPAGAPDRSASGDKILALLKDQLK